MRKIKIILKNKTKNINMKKHNLMWGALVLSVGSVLAKVFSAIYRIILTRVLGGVGIGLYQLIFPFYSLCVVFSTAGLPMAISKVVSKHVGKEKSVLKKCLLFSSLVALVITFILVVSSKGLAHLQGEKELTLCYLILSPSIIIISCSSVLRGYFQGKHNFIPSSISNIVEQFVKLCVGLILSLSLISVGLFPAIIGAVVGIVISEIVSLAVLLIYIKKEKIKSRNKANISIKELTKDIIPITLNNIVLPISTFIDSILVVNLLSKNFSQNMSVFLYGLESGAVASLVSIPTIFSFAIASVILPNLTSSKNSFNRNSKITTAIKIVLIIAVPCVIAFALVPNRIIEFLYKGKLNSYGVSGVVVASRLLAISSFGVVFLALNQIYTSSLQAVDERFVAVRNLAIAVVVKFVIELLFMPSKIFNIYALATANTICYFTAFILNHLEIRTNFNVYVSLTFWGKLILSNSIMLFALITIMSFNNSVTNTMLAGIVAVIIYFISLFKTKILTSKDKAMIKYKI